MINYFRFYNSIDNLIKRHVGDYGRYYAIEMEHNTQIKTLN